MTEPKYAIGDRVIAQSSGSSPPRPGVVIGVITGTIASQVWGREGRYLVHFDGDGGLSGPCSVLRAEGEREDESPRTGTAA